MAVRAPQDGSPQQDHPQHQQAQGEVRLQPNCSGKEEAKSYIIWEAVNKVQEDH